MLKHIFTVTAAILLLANSAAAATELTLWHAYRGLERKGIEQVAKKFNGSQSDIKVTLLPIPYDAFADKITAAVPRGKGPDLFIFSQDRLGDWSASGLIEPIDFWLTDELRGAYLEPTLEALTYDDAVYGLPMAFKTVALFYNKKLVKTPPKDTNELIAAAKKHTGGGKYGLVYENANFYYQAAWLQGFGGRVLSKRGKPKLDDAKVVSSMKFAQRLANDEGIMPDEVNSTLVTTLFNQNKAAFVINGPWFIGEIDSKVKYGVAVLPVINESGERARPFLSAEGVIMNAKTAHKKEAFKVMEFFTGKEAGKIMATVGRQPCARADVYKDAKVAQDPVLAVFKEQLKYSVPMPNMPAMRMVWSPVGKAMNKVIAGKQDPEAVMKKTQGEVKTLVKNAR